MQETLSLNHTEGTLPRLGFVGLGGAGGHVLERLAYPLGAQAWYLDTDMRSLQAHRGDAACVLLGKSITQGLSSGGDAGLAYQAAEADRESLLERFTGVDLIFLFAGLAGGTGGGAAQAVVQAAKDAGALVIVFGFTPFSFEGSRRQLQAEAAVGKLRDVAGAVVTLSNAHLVEEGIGSKTVMAAFAEADRFSNLFVETLWQALSRPGYSPIDMGTLRRIFQPGSGKTLFGIGHGEGEEAVQAVLSDLVLCPLLHLPDYARRADRLLLLIRAGDGFTLETLRTLARRVGEQFSAQDDVVLGLTLEPGWGNRLELCVLGVTDTGTLVHSSGEGQNRQAIDNTTQIASPSSLREGKRRGKGANRDQGEFAFVEGKDQRGFFEKTTANTFRGEDLDVPTYLRRNLKLKL